MLTIAHSRYANISGVAHLPGRCGGDVSHHREQPKLVIDNVKCQCLLMTNDDDNQYAHSMKRFQIKEYGFSELALMYYPDRSQEMPDAASARN